MACVMGKDGAESLGRKVSSAYVMFQEKCVHIPAKAYIQMGFEQKDFEFDLYLFYLAVKKRVFHCI